MRFIDNKLYHVKILTEDRTIETKYGNQVAFDILNVEDNTEFTILPHKVLRSKLSSKKFGVDSEVGIICLGKAEGKTYFDYAVFKWDPKDFEEE